MHAALLTFHRWLALIASGLVMLVATTGAAIAFEGPIRDAKAIRVPVGSSTLSLDTIAARAIARGGGTVTSIAFGGAPDRALLVQTLNGVVAVDPYTGAVVRFPALPSRVELAVRGVHQIHTSLFAGPTGNSLVALVALSSLILVVTGVVIWWRGRIWRVRWSASWKRIIFDLHHALGVLAALVLVVVCGTGVWIGYYKQVNPLVLKLNRTPVATARPTMPAPEPGAIPISLDSVVSLARAAVPGAPLILMQLPANEPVLVAMRYPGDRTPGGRSVVFIDRFRGTVLQSSSTRTAQAGTRLLNLQRPLHTGDILGSFTRVVWLLTSLILASQAVTGVLMWRNRYHS